jgi:hypothetical protein
LVGGADGSDFRIKQQKREATGREELLLVCG